MHIRVEKDLEVKDVGRVRLAVEFDHTGGSLAPDAVLRWVARSILDEGGQRPERPSPRPAPGPVGRLMGNDEGGVPIPRGVHMKALRTVHRIARAVEEETRGGKPATVQAIVDRTGISAQTVYRALRDDGPAWDYTKQLFVFTQAGRTRLVDLTPEGQRVVSRVRAGVLPA